MGEMVSFPSNGGTSEGYLALPAALSAPAVVVIQEYWGLVPHIISLTERFAEAGFVALAPDLYHGQHATEPDEAGKLLMGLAMDQAAKDIACAGAYLTQRPETGGKVGAVGFCAGGSLALWSATISDEIVASVGFYPVLPWERMRPDWSGYSGKSAVIHCSEGTAPRRRRVWGWPGARSRRPAVTASCTTTRAPSTPSSTTTGPRSSTTRRPRARGPARSTSSARGWADRHTPDDPYPR
ncbi:hypothetical protein Pflav_079580 [Phytohabitans flavus]|uniref:Dienelactone hydrolase domain-containing protein n=1 Tax=Phytohabitans flavus TaxID=1076124 RepID=A0A6F8Y6E3_9ACTN|nr:hypothetical protein Pflav_079580 [Phytohabitans flavus]